jgi:hypothetical protein
MDERAASRRPTGRRKDASRHVACDRHPAQTLAVCPMFDLLSNCHA